MECERCGTEHDGSFGTGRFCSRSCANAKTWLEEDKLKKSIAAKNSEKVKKANRLIGQKIKGKGLIHKERKCISCNESFFSKKKEQIFCSLECANSDLGKEIAPRGGKRKGSGVGRKGYYKGFQCDSTYELAYVIWCKENGLEIERNKEYWEYFNPERNGTFKFYPDFLVDGKLVEIKGYHTPVVDLKMNAVRNDNKEISILYKKDLKEAIDIAVKVTELPEHRLYEAYDDHKPIYDHICLNCNVDFSNNKKNSSFCSRKCSGIYRTKFNNNRI